METRLVISPLVTGVNYIKPVGLTTTVSKQTDASSCGDKYFNSMSVSSYFIAFSEFTWPLLIDFRETETRQFGELRSLPPRFFKKIFYNVMLVIIQYTLSF